MFFSPGWTPRSTRATSTPARASVSAAHEPAGPAPTTMASNAPHHATSLRGARDGTHLLHELVNTSRTSPTKPSSAFGKIGALGSMFMQTMRFASVIPPTWCIDPEMPNAK